MAEDMPVKATDMDYYPDFSELHAAGLLSDINIVIKEEQATPDGDDSSVKKAKCSVDSQASNASTKVVPAHKVLLWSLSTFFKAKVTRLVRVTVVRCMHFDDKQPAKEYLDA